MTQRCLRSENPYPSRKQAFAQAGLFVAIGTALWTSVWLPMLADVKKLKLAVDLR